MGASDDGASVADPWPHVWGYENLVVGGNALICTATAMNPTLMSLAIAVGGARRVVEELSSSGAAVADELGRTMSEGLPCGAQGIA